MEYLIGRLRGYMILNNYKIQIVRHVNIYGKDYEYKTDYNHNEIDKFIKYVSPLFNAEEGEFLLFTEINPIGNENQIVESCGFYYIDNNNNKIDAGSDICNLISCNHKINDINIVVYPDIDLGDNHMYKLSRSKLGVVAGVHLFQCENYNSYLRVGDDGLWQSLTINDCRSELEYASSKALSINTSISLEIAFQQWQAEQSTNIINNVLSQIKTELEWKGINSNMVNNTCERFSDLLKENPLSIYNETLDFLTKNY